MLIQHSSVQFLSLKNLELNTILYTVDSVAAFLSTCPMLETLKVYFSYKQEVPIPTSSSSNSLKSTYDNFTWTHFCIDNDYITLGIIGNFDSMMEAFLHVFSPGEKVNMSILFSTTS
ncbi:hypothetical protein TSUD_370300 [Trifolium subterraneum]|uniref:FBD domain-containing protein n=1 Tax=Trifolium subterraneum TaxID=3900 RepID=A0A2Z6NSM9_TRISU|nr:hypothetical protein TSUD_370300 [Trifolium subterraneum]